MFAGANRSFSGLLDAQYEQAGARLLALSQRLSLSQAFAPVNRRTEQAQYLASSNPSNPRFVYAPLNFNSPQLKRDILAVQVPKGLPELSEIYDDKKEQLFLTVELLESIGDSQRMVALSKRLYCPPSSDTLKAAQSIVAAPEIKLPAERKPHSREDLRRAYESALHAAGLADWRAELGTTPQSYVNAANRRVYVGGIVRYSDQDLRRLVEHEVGVHVYRGANGYAQHPAVALPLATGLRGYEHTEEGLAVCAEKSNGFLKQEMLRRYASRVLAVQSVLDGSDFNGTFQLLRGHGFSPHASFTGALRAHRGGGFCKDHIYLEGFLMLERFCAQGGNLKELFVGKIGVRDLALSAKLQSLGYIQQPKLLPKWL